MTLPPAVKDPYNNWSPQMKSSLLLLTAVAALAALSLTGGASATSTCFACAVTTSNGNDCDGHGGISDAISEERESNGNIYLYIGVRCNDGTEFIYDRVYIGPALPDPQPWADPGVGFMLIDEQASPDDSGYQWWEDPDSC